MLFATVHDAMLGVDEVIARAPSAVEVSADVTAWVSKRSIW
jgi:hypothetical protein